jgi:Ca-activated chloride channel family protein
VVTRLVEGEPEVIVETEAIVVQATPAPAEMEPTEEAAAEEAEPFQEEAEEEPTLEATEEEELLAVAPMATPRQEYSAPEMAAPIVNPYIETAADSLSTFALDVDTGSYSAARRYIMEGRLPPPDAVRVEEFVNYFEQDYALPSDAAFGIYADAAPSPFHYDGTHILRVGLKGYDVPAAQRPPTALTFVIDVSGSMAQENRLGLVKQSLNLLVDRMRPEDTLALVVYGTEAWVVMPPTSGSERDAILSAIYSLEPSGSTNAEAGLRLGYQLANESYVANGINRVILASDGVANTGATDPDALSQAIRGYADAGIQLTTLGYGMGDYNDLLMEQLADQGDGNYGYVDTLDEAHHFLVEEMGSTLQTIALNAKVQVDFNPEVVARYRLLGYENRAVADQNFRNNAVDAGEIGAGHTVTALYALQFVPGAAGRIASVHLRWEDPTTHEVQEIAGETTTGEIAPYFDAASPRYQLDVMVAHVAELLRQSPYTDGVTLAELASRIERLAAQLDDTEVNELVTLVARASQLQP